MDLATIPGLEAPHSMQGKVFGEIGGLLIDLACRDCPTVAEAYEYFSNGLVGSKPGGSNELTPRPDATGVEGNSGPIFVGRRCVGPTRRFLVVGKAMCHGEFYPNSL